MMTPRQLPRNTSTITATSAVAIAGLAHDPRDRGADEHRLIEVDAQLEAVRRRRLDDRQRVAGGIDDGERRRARLAQDREVAGTVAVDADDVLLDGDAVVDVRDVAEPHDRAAGERERVVGEARWRGPGWR